MAKILPEEAPIVASAQPEGGEGDRAEFVAFIVRRPDADQFLCSQWREKGVEHRKWIGGTPEFSHRFARLKRARKAASDDDTAEVALLFQTPRQWIVMDIPQEAL